MTINLSLPYEQISLFLLFFLLWYNIMILHLSLS